MTTVSPANSSFESRFVTTTCQYSDATSHEYFVHLQRARDFMKALHRKSQAEGYDNMEQVTK